MEVNPCSLQGYTVLCWQKHKPSASRLLSWPGPVEFSSGWLYAILVFFFLIQVCCSTYLPTGGSQQMSGCGSVLSVLAGVTEVARCLCIVIPLIEHTG